MSGPCSCQLRFSERLLRDRLLGLEGKSGTPVPLTKPRPCELPLVNPKDMNGRTL
jgi:hypothetical protein